MANGLFGGGDGSPGNPYLVEDAYDFQAINDNLTAHYLQVSDIDMGVLGNDFMQIAVAIIDDDGGYIWREFSGTYDGGNFAINNFNFTAPNANSNRNVPCLFYILENAILRNIRVVDAITRTSMIPDERGDYPNGCGILVYMSYGDKVVIENCHITGNMYNNGATGGGALIVEVFDNETIIRNCSFEGEVFFEPHEETSSPATGGLISATYGANTIIEDCYSRCNMQSNGGITALFLCSSYGDYISIDRCFAEGTITMGHVTLFSNYNIGLIGEVYGETDIRNCYVNMSVEGDPVSEPRDVSITGITVSYDYVRVTVENCYSVIRNNTRFVAYPYFDPTYEYGEYTFALNCYFDNDLNPNNQYQGGRTTDEMMKRITFENWDFQKIWSIREGMTYPTFKKGMFGQLDAILLNSLKMRIEG